MNQENHEVAIHQLSKEVSCAALTATLLSLISLIQIIDQASTIQLQLQWQQVHDGDYWRLLSCFFVHSNPAHALMNMAGLTLIAWHWRHQLTLGHYLFALLFGAVAVNMGYLLFYPLNTEYFGFSALLYTLLTYSCIITIRHEKWINLFILSAVSFAVLRPLWADGAGQSSQELIGVRVATESHLYGWIGGFIAGGTWWARQLQANVKPTPT